MVDLHCIILSSLPECLKFPIETTVEVSVACMLSFSYEDSINVYRFIARVAYQLAQAIYIDVCKHTHWNINIDTTSNKLFFWSLSQLASV